ncbi:MAG: protein-ADP-ribose hydrolase [Eubacterium sp.]|jgi:O-acetyl-ADP-ribose deacetylase (regulator of RNase III)
MTTKEQAEYLIRELEKEMPEYSGYPVPDDPDEAFNLFRALCNVRMPKEISDEFASVESEYLQEITKAKGITDCKDLLPVESDKRLWLWQGDITTLKCDAIVNAANSGMLGCFRPLHNCIDNIIHTMAGVELRNECSRRMKKLAEKYGNEYEQPTSVPMITPGYNLPAKYVIHVVGPIVTWALTDTHKKQLSDCYSNCLKMAEDNACESVAFCCISTGVFMFPADEAAKIAVSTVKEFLDEHDDGAVKRVIFNVFKDRDLEIYRNVLGETN